MAHGQRELKEMSVRMTLGCAQAMIISVFLYVYDKRVVAWNLRQSV